MTRKPKADDPPPVYEVDELPVERRLFTRERREQSGPLVVERDGKKVVLERRKSPGRRKTDRGPGPRKA